MTEITHLTSIHLSFIHRLRFLLKMLKKHKKMKQKCNAMLSTHAWFINRLNSTFYSVSFNVFINSLHKNTHKMLDNDQIVNMSFILKT